MPFTVTSRINANTGTSSQQTYVTSSFTPSANSLLVVWAFCENPNSASGRNWGITDSAGLTWTKRAETPVVNWNGDSNFRFNAVCWTAPVGGSPAAMTVTVDPASSGTDTFFIGTKVFDITGHDVSSPMAQAPVAFGEDEANSSSASLALTLGSAATNGNLSLAMFASSADGGDGFASMAGWTPLINESATWNQGAVFYRTDFTGTSVTNTDLGDLVGASGGVIMEIANATPPPTWTNHVTIAAPRNGTTSHTVDPSAGTVVGGAAFTPIAGRLLVCVVNGGVTSTTPAGWTLPTNGSAVNFSGLYVWHRTAAGGDTLTTTHNGSDYPVIFDIYEFPSGSTFVSAASATGIAPNGGFGTPPTVSGLTGVNTIIGAIGYNNVDTTDTWAWTWAAGPTEAVDYSIVKSGTEGYAYSAAYTSDSAAASAQYTATTTTSTASAEQLIFAINVGSGGPTLIGETEAFPATNAAVNVTLPAGSATGDACVVACVANKGDSALPGGFTQIGFDNAQDNIEMRTSIKTLTGTDITNGYVTMPGDPNFNGIRYQLWIVRNGEIDVSSITSGVDLTGTNSVNTATSVTTTVANTLLLAAFGGRGSGTSWGSISADLVADQNNPSGYASMWAGHAAVASAGATGTRTATNVGAGFQRWGATLIALKVPTSSAPAQVTGLDSVQTGRNIVTLTWTAPSDGGSAITGYMIERAPDSAGSPGTWATLTANTGNTSVTYNDTTATSSTTPGTTYWYRVSAINAIGTGTASAADSVASIIVVPLALVSRGRRRRLR